MNTIYQEDIENIVTSTLIDWGKFSNKTFLITGASGLLGGAIVDAIKYRNEYFDANIKIIILVHKNSKFSEDKNVSIISGEIDKFNIGDNIDYIIHAAAPTKSSFFVENPVETMDAIILGTRNILEIAKKSKIKSMIYLSSMEVYGSIDDLALTEEKLGFVSLKSVRSSYSEAKRASELYCHVFANEYDVPVKMARLAQVFGSGVSLNDNRLPNYIVKSILNEENIILKSDGMSSVNFCYISDAVKAIFLLLQKGNNGESYNICGNTTGLNIKELCELLIRRFDSKIKLQILGENQNEFAPTTKMFLLNGKIKKIGWSPEYGIFEAYDRLMEYYRS